MSLAKALLAFGLAFARGLAAGRAWLRGSSGGGETEFSRPRRLVAADVAVPEGCRSEAVAGGFTFPVAAAFDGEGRPVVVEAGDSCGEVGAERLGAP